MTPTASTELLLRHRGPDATGQHRVAIELDSACAVQEASPTRVHATFLSTVLALRGKEIVQQPLKDATTDSVLCWNGEAWSISGQAINGNDSQLVFARLLEACAGQSTASTCNVVELVSAVRGPYAFVFYDAPNKRVYYGRDCLGRRSLLRKDAADGTIVLSSVCDNVSGEAWAEVDADGIHVVDLLDVHTAYPLFSDKRIPHRRFDQDQDSEVSFVGKWPCPWVLLTPVDSALSSNELLHLGQSHPRFQCGRPTEDVFARVSASSHRTCPRGSSQHGHGCAKSRQSGSLILGRP